MKQSFFLRFPHHRHLSNVTRKGFSHSCASKTLKFEIYKKPHLGCLRTGLEHKTWNRANVNSIDELMTISFNLMKNYAHFKLICFPGSIQRQKR